MQFTRTYFFMEFLGYFFKYRVLLKILYYLCFIVLKSIHVMFCKRLFILLFLFIAFYVNSLSQISKWDGSAICWTKGDGSETHPYLIDSASHLAYLAQSVNAGRMYADTFFRLSTHIDLDTLNWTPIGCSVSEFFAGHFDGDNHSIYHLYCKDTIQRPSIVCTGLFGYVMDAEIYNLHIADNSEILSSFSTSYNFYVGGIAGYAYASEIRNCSFDGKVSVYAVSSFAYAGGIVGYAASGTNIYNCHNKGKIFSSSLNTAYAGGILADCDNASPKIKYCYNEGYVYATAHKYTYAGGVVARLNYGASVERCFNSGDVETYSNSCSYIGGLIGWGSNCLVKESYNEGVVNAIAYDYSYAGGVVGFTEFPSVIEHVYNRGRVLSNSYYYKSFVGGIIGNVHNFSHIPTLVRSCYNAGQLYAVSSAFLGGICGEVVNHSEVSNAYCLQMPSFYPTNSIGEMVDVSFLYSRQALDSLNQGQEVWISDEALINDGFPLLKNTGKTLVLTHSPAISSTDVVLKGSVVQLADTVLSKAFVYKKHNATTFTHVPADSSADFQTVISAIAADTLYEYRAYVVVKTDTVFGKSLLFKIGKTSIRTLAATDLKAHTAVLNAEIEYGKDTILAKGFKWRKVAEVADNYLSADKVYFSDVLFSLPSYTDFVYQAFALTLSDTIFGDKVYFKTLPQQSSVETEAATNVSPYSALVAAAIQYGDDTIIKKGFEWRAEEQSIADVFIVNDTAFTAKLNDLQSNTNYFYRSFIITTTDTLFGNELAFKTLRACTLQTSGVVYLGTCSVVLKGYINVPDEQIYMQGFAWRKCEDSTDNILPTEGTAICDTLYGLNAQTDYTFRVFVITNNGVFYSEPDFFRTLGSASGVTTLEASDIGVETAVLHGQVEYGDEEILMQGFEYKMQTAENYTIVKAEGSNMSDTLSRLQPKTTYEYRAFIVLAERVIYGETLSFITLEDVEIEEIADNCLHFYPNPVDDNLYLIFENDAYLNGTIEIVDVYGKSCLSQRITSKNMLVDMKHLTSSCYFLTVQQDNLNRKIYKIIKK